MILSRVTDKAAALLENIVFSLVAHQSTVLINNISGHFPINYDLLIPNKQTKPLIPKVSPFNLSEKNLAHLNAKILQQPH